MADNPTDESIVVPRQDQISVFPNQGGGVSIRLEQDDLYGSQPSELIIPVPLEYVDALVAALLKAKRDAEAG